MSRWFERRFAKGNARMRRIGIVALARKLLVALWRYLEEGVPRDDMRHAPYRIASSLLFLFSSFTSLEGSFLCSTPAEPFLRPDRFTSRASTAPGCIGRDAALMPPPAACRAL